jgi:hypothetical protein
MMKQTNEIESKRVKITDPYTLELVTESPFEYKQKVKELLETSGSKDEIIQAVMDLKNTGACSFIPHIAGFMVDAGLLGKNHDGHLELLLQVISEK